MFFFSHIYIYNILIYIYINNTQLVCSRPGRGAQEHQGPVPPRAGRAGQQRFRCGDEGLQANPGTGARQQGPDPWEATRQ